VWPEFQTRRRRDVLQMLGCPPVGSRLPRISRAPAASPDSLPLSVCWVTLHAYAASSRT
jgi:hypothetical protein